jgi:hypothetical protein
MCQGLFTHRVNDGFPYVEVGLIDWFASKFDDYDALRPGRYYARFRGHFYTTIGTPDSTTANRP